MIRGLDPKRKAFEDISVPERDGGVIPRALSQLGLLALVTAIPASSVGWCADGPRRHPLRIDSIRHEIGHCYIASMDFGEEGDKHTGNKSTLMLYEDGRPLGPPRSVHQDIRKKGSGRYSHWTREGLYFSASDNTDPRTNGRKYEVASKHPGSTLGGLARFPATPRKHVEEIRSREHRYVISMGGTLDMENTRTLAGSNCTIAFQPNMSLTIENTGDAPVVNPRLVINDRGNWYTFDSLLAEFTRGATTDQEKVYFIWQSMRENLYHESPLFGDAEPHDPVKLLNIFGFNLCDDAGSAGCSLFYHAGFKKSKNRALHGHVQCEAFVGSAYQFMDIDMDCFYLDRENERPVSGDECARDHDLVRRELNYGQVVSRFVSSDRPAALFGPDDRQFDARLRGHEIAYVLRPGEKAIFRWDNMGKYCAENKQRAHRPRYFGNSRFVYRPRLELGRVKAEAEAVVDVAQAPANGKSHRLAGTSPRAYVTYAIKVPYAVAGGAVRAEFSGLDPRDRFSIALSVDGKTWKELWTKQGVGAHAADVALDGHLELLRAPAKYSFHVRVGLGSVSRPRSASLHALEIETDVLAAPVSLPRLRLGTNHVVYTDGTEGSRQVRVSHEWRETDAIKPLLAVDTPTYPQPNAEIRDSVVTFSWPATKGAERYHLQVSRRADFRYPYRTSLDVVIPATKWTVPYTGIFSPDTNYYWRLRCRDRWGVWSPWSQGWPFTWRGPRVPVGVRASVQGQTVTLHWKPNPRGERPVKYAIYGSDEKGFSVRKGEHNVPGRGKVPGNFLAETTAMSMVVAGPTAAAGNANKVFYRVVASDASGTESGCSDYAELPHPFVCSRPVTQARVGKPYRYQVKSLRSLGDYQCKQDPTVKRKKYAYKFWDVEQATFRLVRGPKWLSIGGRTGLLSGTPSAEHVGTARVEVEVADQFNGRAAQSFSVAVVQ